MAFDNEALSDIASEDVLQEGDVLTFEVEYGGDTHTIGWRADGLALQRAADQGLEVGEILEKVTRLATTTELTEELSDDLDEEEVEELVQEIEDTGLEMSEYVELVAEIVWIGWLRIDPSMPFEAVLALIDQRTIAEDIPLGSMLDRLMPAVEEEGEGK